MNKTDAAKKKATWLAYCLHIGWDKKDLDGLSETWDRYYDENGNRKPSEPLPASSTSAPKKSKEEILDRAYLSKMHWTTVNRARVIKAMETYASQQEDYWKQRCEAAEHYFLLSKDNGDTDDSITQAFDKWQQLKQNQPE